MNVRARMLLRVVVILVLSTLAVTLQAGPGVHAAAPTDEPCLHCQPAAGDASAMASAADLFGSLWNTAGFPPRWECGTWSARLGWLHIGSDLAIWLAYLAIPCVLAYFILKRKDMPFPRLIWLFVAFIVACGTTHLIEAMIFWWPAYRLAGVVKFVTAVVSVATVLVMIPLVPQVLALQSPKALEIEVAQRTEEVHRTQEALRQTNEALEQRILERTEELRQSQQELQQVNEKLEQMVQARTSELEEQATELRAQRTAALNMMDDADRLAQETQRAERKLAAANEEMEQFVYTISHDLKSPLVTIQGFTTCVRDDLARGKTDELVDYIGRINGAAARMTDLIDDLLELSRAGRVAHAPEPVNTCDLWNEVICQHEAVITERQLDIQVQDNLPILNVDRVRFMEVFDNLLVNAFKYGCDTAHPKILIGSRQVGKDIHIFVRDWGPGVPEAYRQKVFELFQRLQSDKDGTGIGLALVKRVVEVHGGRVWVESSEGQGATFVLSFPQSLIVCEESANVQGEPHGNEADTLSLGGR